MTETLREKKGKHTYPKIQVCPLSGRGAGVAAITKNGWRKLASIISDTEKKLSGKRAFDKSNK